MPQLHNPLLEEWKHSHTCLTYGGWLERELLLARQALAGRTVSCARCNAASKRCGHCGAYGRESDGNCQICGFSTFHEVKNAEAGYER